MHSYTRRTLVQLPVGAILKFLAVLPQVSRAAHCGAKPRGDPDRAADTTWDMLVHQLRRLAVKQFEPNWNEADYVNRVARIARQMTAARPYPPPTTVTPGRPHFRDLEKTATFQITLLSLDEGESIPLHNHPGMTGVMACLQGAIDVSSYDILGPGAQTGKVSLVLKQSATLIPSNISTLTSTSRNIHSVKSRAGSQLLDIFTPPYSAERIQQSRWYVVDPGPSALGEGRMFNATVVPL